MKDGILKAFLERTAGMVGTSYGTKGYGPGDVFPHSRPAMLLFSCEECGGVVPKHGAHDGDPEACELEKVRQVMEA